MIKLWERHFYQEILKVFLFFLLGFFFLYSVIEYSTHMNDFFKENEFQVREVIFYYINQLLKRLDFLIPMAILLATIKVLTSLNLRNEWLVLQTAGISTRRLLRPFFCVAIAGSFFIYLNFEVFLPSAMRHIDEFKIAHFQNSHVAKRRDQIHLIPLPDNTKLIYQSFDQEKNVLFDVLWIKSLDELWRIKSLNANPQEPIAEYADHIVRNPSGFFEKKDSYLKIRLHDLKWHPRMARKSLIPFEQRRLSELHRMRSSPTAAPYDLPKIKTAYSFKLAIPLLSPLLVMAVAPFCLTSHRQRHFFLVYALGLFGLFAVYMLLDSLAILSENQVIAPSLAIYTPLAFLLSISSWRFFSKT